MDVLALSAVKETGLLERIEGYRSALESDNNEAQTRFHVSDSFLEAELEWHRNAIRVEP